MNQSRLTANPSDRHPLAVTEGSYRVRSFRGEHFCVSLYSRILEQPRRVRWRAAVSPELRDAHLPSCGPFRAECQGPQKSRRRYYRDHANRPALQRTLSVQARAVVRGSRETCEWEIDMMKLRPAGTFPKFYLNTYTPLAHSMAGREASLRFGLLPFIDGSIRREPDLQHKWPAISCLCRADKFAPRLRLGDFVVYMTCTGNWHKPGKELPPRHRRLTAVLRAEALCDSHDEAAKWYRSRELPLPSNCVVPGNDAQALERSHRMTRFRCAMSEGELHDTWDSAYQRRAENYPRFVICEPLFISLGWDAPKVGDTLLEDVFGKVPGTQNPGVEPIECLNDLMSRLELGQIPGVPV